MLSCRQAAAMFLSFRKAASSVQLCWTPLQLNCRKAPPEGRVGVAPTPPTPESPPATPPSLPLRDLQHRGSNGGAGATAPVSGTPAAAGREQVWLVWREGGWVRPSQCFSRHHRRRRPSPLSHGNSPEESCRGRAGPAAAEQVVSRSAGKGPWEGWLGLERSRFVGGWGLYGVSV